MIRLEGLTKTYGKFVAVDHLDRHDDDAVAVDQVVGQIACRVDHECHLTLCRDQVLVLLPHVLR